MNDRDRIISQVQMMASKAFNSLGGKYVSFHEDDAVSVMYMGYIVKISLEVKVDKTKKLLCQY